MASLGYQIKNRKQTARFTCSHDCILGAYSFKEGDRMIAISDPQGMFDLYVEWANGTIGKFYAEQINKLAGFQAVQS